MTGPSTDLFRLLHHFEQEGVRYLIIGGLAVNRYGFARTTGDADIYLEDSSENRRALIRALAAAGYAHFEPLMTMQMVAGYCEILMDDGLYADLMTDIPGLTQSSFDEYRQAALTERVDGVLIHYISYQHLLKNKAATARTKDLLDIEELEKRNDHGTDSPR